MSTSNNSNGRDLVNQLFNAAFDKPRDPRSAEYKAGALAALEFRVMGLPVPCPHSPGTAQADAFFSGLDEGHAIWRRHVEAEKRSAAPDASADGA